jgi:hypothetical protein
MMQKKFYIGETKFVQLRIEAYNPLNRTRFGNPDTNLYSYNFGIITSTQGNARRLQLALRYQF